ncbi:hypothetical protein V500_01253 [Pseudogymnoascus sp. VKM F-4518 (FW-2643)]|nr:hypothetical protein V500_01253 [Pseudogymnoascus sp. VKM F-4518 (FW-2643)]
MCPYAADYKKRDGSLYHRQTDDVDTMKDYTIDDTDVFLTSDVGGAFVADKNNVKRQAVYPPRHMGRMH